MGSLSDERKKLFEEELLGKTPNAGRIYRKILAQDRKAVQELKAKIKKQENNYTDGCFPKEAIFVWIKIVFGDKLVGKEYE